MGVLEQVTQLKSQGYGEEDIYNSLQEQGISPGEIHNALNQSQIKSAVSSEAYNSEAPSPEQGGYYSPQTQEYQEGAYPEQQGGEYYQENAYAQPSGGMDSETIIEITNQVFAEKIKKTEKRVEEIEELKTIVQVKMANIEERLKRIEKMFDTLQIQIIEKVGSYGRELASTKKEVSMLEDTLGKTIKAKAEKHTSHKK